MAKQQIRIFKMESSRVYYTPTAYVPISNTSLAGYNVVFPPNTYWKVEIKRYDSVSGEVEAKVREFQSAEASAFKAQATSVQLKRLKFEHLSGSKPGFSKEQAQHKQEESPKPYTLRDETFQINFPLDSLDFQNEKIVLPLDGISIPGWSLEGVQISIANPVAREQLNAIKRYIIKSFGSETVSVHVRVRETKPGYVEISGYSDQLGQINEGIVERASYDYLLQMISSSPTTEPSSFSPEEFAEKQLGMKVGPVRTLEFIRDMNRMRQALHFEHIEYLCVRQNEHFPIRFITAPSFAFLIVVETGSRLFAVLECYDKPLATYIWHYGKTSADTKVQLKQVYESVEAELLKAGKRSSYLKNKPGNFCKVEHTYRNPNGFRLWKDELDAKLV